MKISTHMVLAVPLFCGALLARAEPIAPLPGQVVPYSMEANAAFSLKSAKLVVQGKFRRVSSENQAPGFVEVEFQVETWLSGQKPASPVLRLSLPLAENEAKTPANQDKAAQQVIDDARLNQPKLEARLEQRKITQTEFTTWSRHYRELLQRSDDYGRKFVLVAVTPGALDAPYRHADVLLEFGEPVILMLQDDYREGKRAQNLFSYQYDLYPASDARVRRLLGLK